VSTLFDGLEVAQESVATVIKSLQATCVNCRLGLLHPHNRGLIYRGNPFAEIGILHEAPRDSETERGVAMIGAHGREFERWMRLLELDLNKDIFLTTVVQCQPPREERNGKMMQREPEEAEVSACFGPRALRVFRAMPNLKVVITLGWPAAKALFGGKPISKTHDSQWFETSRLPGIPVFCLVDPVWVVRDPSPDKSSAVERALTLFQREYLKEHWVVDMAADARAAREAAGLGLL
jgi:DNA polymerase